MVTSADAIITRRHLARGGDNIAQSITDTAKYHARHSKGFIQQNIQGATIRSETAAVAPAALTKNFQCHRQSVTQYRLPS